MGSTARAVSAGGLTASMILFFKAADGSALGAASANCATTHTGFGHARQYTCRSRAAGVRFHLRALFAFEHAESVLFVEQSELFAGHHELASPSDSRSRSSPLRIQLFTVPSASPVVAAISLCDRPSKNASSIARRCFSGRGSHQCANFFGAPGLVDISLGIRANDCRRNNVGIRILAAALLLALQAQKIQRAIAGHGENSHGSNGPRVI